MAPPAFLNLQLADGKLWYFLASVITWPLPLINLLLPICVSALLVFMFQISVFLFNVQADAI